MNYLEILENLGVAKNYSDRVNRFYANISDCLAVYEDEEISASTIISACKKVGIPLRPFSSMLERRTYEKIGEEFLRQFLFPNDKPLSDIRDFLARISILISDDFFKEDDSLMVYIEKQLDYWKLPYVLYNDIFIPRGVKEFDKALVFDVAGWLQRYPSAHKAYVTSLRQYYNDDEPRDIADNLRKSLEAFLQEFLGNKRNLDNNIGEVGTYLKNNGANEEIRNMFTTLVRHYKLSNDKTAKHHDLTNKQDIEFLLYQTGLFMRYLLVIKETEK